MIVFYYGYEYAKGINMLHKNIVISDLECFQQLILAIYRYDIIVLIPIPYRYCITASIDVQL